jgi:MSHA pilin protein MshD
MKQHKGFSLIEIVIFIIIVGVAVGAMTMQFSTSVAHSHEPLLRQKAVSLANFYMDEILRKKWNENTPTGGGCVNTGSGTCPAGPAAAAIGMDGDTRATFDDVDDYNGLNNNPPQDHTGTALANFAGYAVTVAVTTGTTWDPLGNAARDVAANDVLRIQVNVAVAATSETITLTAFRNNF